MPTTCGGCSMRPKPTGQGRCAGQQRRHSQGLPLAQHSDELFEQTFNIHARGTFNTLREAATRLNDGGRIINFSSSTVGLNLPGYAVYIASKAAVESLTQVFAKEMRGRNITVNAVAPGPVATDLFLQGKSEEQIQNFAKMAPLERLGQPRILPVWCRFWSGRIRLGSMGRFCG